ncbi:MAG: Asp23/Gls24 family envelope stress response protein [Clostridia bacterium]|nr:Asp23/Gls24 family envelope stress response protein [Clostridia bacterium]
MSDTKTELNVSTEVLEKMTRIAATEVSGVAGLPKKAVDLRDVIKAKSAFKEVKIDEVNGSIEITVYICVKQGVQVREVAEAVQQNVKEKVQSLTGTVVTRVNVCIADVEDFKEEETV